MKNISTTARRVILMGAMVAVLTVVTGCKNTAHGAGQDIERAGEKIQEKTN